MSISSADIYDTTIILPEPDNSPDLVHLDGLYIDIVNTRVEIGPIGGKVFFKNVFVNGDSASSFSADVSPLPFVSMS